MFTGIVGAVGAIVASDPMAGGRRLTVQTPAGWLAGALIGDSIAINGACMTATSFPEPGDRFTVDVSAESLACTAGLDALGPVNLEQSVRPRDRLGGHWVSGHVDAVGTVVALDPIAESIEFRVLAPKALGRFIAAKGSITVQGVSLTVNRLRDLAEGCEFSINLIPHTIANTTLGRLVPGSPVNLEIDLIARYVERMLSARE